MKRTRRSGARKSAKRRPARAKARRATPARGKRARKAARKGRRKPARKSVRRAPPRGRAKAARKRTAKRAARKPARLAIVRPRKRAAKRATPAPAAREAGESPKQRVLFELMRARAAVHGAVHGLGAEHGTRPTGKDKWSARDILLHLAVRDRVRLREMEAVLRGAPASWWAWSKEEQNRHNIDTLNELGHLGWDEAVEYCNATRRELLEALESVPEDPAELWTPEHNFGRMILGLPEHDRHHAETIQRWRESEGV
jgi:hypothetical protein